MKSYDIRRKRQCSTRSGQFKFGFSKIDIDSLWSEYIIKWIPYKNNRKCSRPKTTASTSRLVWLYVCSTSSCLLGRVVLVLLLGQLEKYLQ